MKNKESRIKTKIEMIVKYKSYLKLKQQIES